MVGAVDQGDVDLVAIDGLAQIASPVAGNLALSFLAAAIPIAVVLVMLFFFRRAVEGASGGDGAGASAIIGGQPH